METKNLKVKSVEEAKKIVEQEEKNNQEQCLKEIDAVLKKYGYKLQINNTITLGKE